MAAPARRPVDPLGALLAEIRGCRICEAHLPHGVRPVLRASTTARICIVGQAPGIRVHESGIPFNDPCGERLRDWMGIDRDTFYDESRIAIVPMGFCFPGYDAKGADKPPRKECAQHWRDPLFAQLPPFALTLDRRNLCAALASGRNGEGQCQRDCPRLARLCATRHPLAASVVAQQCLVEEESMVRNRTPARFATACAALVVLALTLCGLCAGAGAARCGQRAAAYRAARLRHARRTEVALARMGCQGPESHHRRAAWHERLFGSLRHARALVGRTWHHHLCL